MRTIKPRAFFYRFGRFIFAHEKVMLALLAVVIVISGTFWYRQFSHTKTDGPTTGGTYVEGIVGSTEEVKLVASHLTKTGLFTIDPDGGLRNQLVSSWEANQDKTSYSFILLPNINPDEIISQLNADADMIGPGTFSNDGQKLAINLPQPDPSLPLLLTQPIFNYGPYKASKITDKTTIFTRNTRENAVKPYINKIVVQSYATADQLKSAVEKGKVDGAEDVGATLPDGYHEQLLNFPRYYAVLFNSNLAPFRDGGLRRSLIDETSAASTPFTLIVTDKEPYKSLANDLVNQWRNIGAKVTIETKSADEIKNKIGPSRDFQALLTGVDYGSELDPFYLWDSSQVRPPNNNLTGVKNSGIDKLLSDVRSTLNVKDRLNIIDQLHQELNRQGAAFFIKEESVPFILSDSISASRAWIPQTADDRYSSIADWFVK